MGLAAAAGAWARRHPSVRELLGGLLPNVGSAMTAGFLVWLALLANTALRDIDEARRAVHAEATALRSFNATSDALGPAPGLELRELLVRYGQRVVDVEWIGMSDVGEDVEAATLMERIESDVLQRFKAAPDDVRAALRQSALDLNKARQTRLGVAIDHVPAVTWCALHVSGLIVVLFSALAHAPRWRSGLILGALLGTLIAVQTFAVLSVDRPFVGHIAVPSDPIRAVLPILGADRPAR